MKDKLNIILFVMSFIAGVLIIYLTPDGKNGYWLIPLTAYWIIRYIRRKIHERKSNAF